ncbi:MAG: SGNH/GDSL hydrolase family protein [Ruminococcaceae bacterium]|nr:SGNH/GDSL hydrolase family protein [Oscillospiraceae bacterium]
MNVHDLYFNPNEKPLDNICRDGGFVSIFRTIACVGDSLSSGEFETLEQDTGVHHYYDMFEYSWGQFLGRMSGSKVYNFSRGGMTASEYCDSFAEAKGFWDADKKAQAYIIALGINDLIGARQPLGEMSDINPEDPTQNAKTFTGYYARIIQTYQKMVPGAKFFLVTIPRQELYEAVPDLNAVGDAHRARLCELAAYFDNTYVVDLREYGPFHDAELTKRFYLYGHMNALGYRFMAEQIASYIDYIVRHNAEDFNGVPFVNSETPMLC